LAKTGARSKLAVVLHADVVGSTRLVRRDERVAHERIQSAFHRLAGHVSAYGGTPRELRGDALLAEFDRTSDAICAALAFQTDNAASNAALDDDILPEVRIGISLGEVIIAEDILTGADVVLAQRLEQLAGPGQVCVSQAVRQATPRRLPFNYHDLGEQPVKGFDEPVHAYGVSMASSESLPGPAAATARQAETVAAGGGGRTAALAAGVVMALAGAGVVGWWGWPWQDVAPEPTEQRAQPVAEKPSIAVLPFGNLSADPDQEYFGDGIAEDLITDLSKVSGLLVVSRNSSFTFKGKAAPIREVANALGVRYVVEGSVRRAGNTLRINAQLIDASTDSHLWAERYDGTVSDVFALQDRVTRQIVEALSVTLTPGEAAGRETKLEVSPAAYDAYLRGRGLQERASGADAVAAVSRYREALALQPEFADATAALASLLWNHAWDRDFQVSEEGFAVEQVGQRGATWAAELMAWELLQNIGNRASLSPAALALESRMLQRQHRFSEAGTFARRALALGPSSPEAHDALIEHLLYAGRTNEARALLQRAEALRPNQPAQGFYLRALTAFADGDVNEAAGLIQRARRHAPGFGRYALFEATLLSALSRPKEASRALADYRSQSVSLVLTVSGEMQRWPFQSVVLDERFAAALRSLGLTQTAFPYRSRRHDLRLGTTEIQRTSFGRRMLGTETMNFDEVDVIRAEDGTVVGQGWINVLKGGRSEARDDLLCDEWYNLGRYCVAIYRDPGAGPGGEDQFFFYTLSRLFQVAVLESE
jgi:TolB-like protein/class 3 adenylate cyclase